MNVHKPDGSQGTLVAAECVLNNIKIVESQRKFQRRICSSDSSG